MKTKNEKQKMQKNNVKETIVRVASLFFALLMLPFFAIAADYVPLAPLGVSIGPVQPGQSVSLGGYLSEMFQWIIGIAGVLAVLMIVIAGIEYMSPVPSAKESGKNRAMAAILGLILALVSYLILQTINPDLVLQKLDLQSSTSNTQRGSQ